MAEAQKEENVRDLNNGYRTNWCLHFNGHKVCVRFFKIKIHGVIECVWFMAIKRKSPSSIRFIAIKTKKRTVKISSSFTLCSRYLWLLAAKQQQYEKSLQSALRSTGCLL